MLCLNSLLYLEQYYSYTFVVQNYEFKLEWVCDSDIGSACGCYPCGLFSRYIKTVVADRGKCKRDEISIQS